MITSCASSSKHRDEEKRLKDATTMIELGMGYMRQGKDVVAREKLERALEISPKMASAHNAIAILYEKQGRTELANNHYKKAVKLDPEDGSALNNYGVFLCRNGKFEEGEKYFLKTIDLPEYRTPELAYENIGLCSAWSGDMEKSERYFKLALDRNKRLPMSLIELAKLKYKQENYLLARAFLQRFEAVSEHNAETLGYAFKIEYQLKAKDRYLNYFERLTKEFPESEQAEEITTKFGMIN
jgi:type IV pilus assembly protein PilF